MIIKETEDVFKEFDHTPKKFTKSLENYLIFINVSRILVCG